MGYSVRRISQPDINHQCLQDSNHDEELLLVVDRGIEYEGKYLHDAGE